MIPGGGYWGSVGGVTMPESVPSAEGGVRVPSEVPVEPAAVSYAIGVSFTKLELL
jgi:hypothetical protein